MSQLIYRSLSHVQLAVDWVTQGVSMPAQDVPDFGLARLNSVRVGEEEEDVEFRNTLNAGISTDIADLLQENGLTNVEVCKVQMVEHNYMSNFFSVLSYT